uniref:Uncharacterized protein n=1 Tax=Anguilla anguilla TaxID=7936 RepID=A0A0E9XAP6_ANGAN
MPPAVECIGEGAPPTDMHIICTLYKCSMCIVFLIYINTMHIHPYRHTLYTFNEHTLTHALQ